MSATIGMLFKLTCFGESHGSHIGGVIDGFPSNFALDFEAIQKELDRRKPGQNALTSSRKESDSVQFISGIFEGKTTGAPITYLIQNEDQRSKDYEKTKTIFRPSHADFTYHEKYKHRDYRGGGRQSARVTATWVVAGAIAKQYLSRKNIKIFASVDQVGMHKSEGKISSINHHIRETNDLNTHDSIFATLASSEILFAKKMGDSLGGCIQCVVENMPIAWGEPLFDKLHARIGHHMLTINACKGVEFGMGFDFAEQLGSSVNDAFTEEKRTSTNNSGGIQGGISNGMDLFFRCVFKPVATILKPQNSINEEGEAVVLQNEGRHDPCVVPRAVPIVEALTAMALLDFQLLHQSRI
jgi:chorismate synthase